MTGMSRSFGLHRMAAAGAGLVTLLGGCGVVAQGGSAPSALGDTRWRVEAAVTTSPPVLRLWDGQGRDARLVVENRVFLPSDLARPQSDWQLLQLQVHANRLVVLLQYRPQPNVGTFQHKHFEFDLLAPNRPLVFYRVATTRGETVNWQTVDFKTHKSWFCRNAPSATPDACTPLSAILSDDPVPNLGNIGSAEDYAPPVKTEVRY
jgi:hypothetical protein